MACLNFDKLYLIVHVFPLKPFKIILGDILISAHWEINDGSLTKKWTFESEANSYFLVFKALNLINLNVSQFENWTPRLNKTWSFVSNSSLSKTFELGSLESLKFRSLVLSFRSPFWVRKNFESEKHFGSEKKIRSEKF